MLTKCHVKLYYCVFLIFTFKVAVRKMEDSEMSGSKNSRYLICSYFFVNVFLIVCVIFYGRIYLISKCPFIYIQGVTGGTDQTSGECSLGQTIPI